MSKIIIAIIFTILILLSTSVDVQFSNTNIDNALMTEILVTLTNGIAGIDVWSNNSIWAKTEIEKLDGISEVMIMNENFAYVLVDPRYDREIIAEQIRRHLTENSQEYY